MKCPHCNLPNGDCHVKIAVTAVYDALKGHGMAIPVAAQAIRLILEVIAGAELVQAEHLLQRKVVRAFREPPPIRNHLL